MTSFGSFFLSRGSSMQKIESVKIYRKSKKLRANVFKIVFNATKHYFDLKTGANTKKI
jgi:hypothetical protein